MSGAIGPRYACNGCGLLFLRRWDRDDHEFECELIAETGSSFDVWTDPAASEFPTGEAVTS